MDLEEIIKELKGLIADYDRERTLLLGRIDDLENVQAGLLERGIALEQLCRDMYKLTEWVTPEQMESIEQRMDALGLLEGGENE